MRTLFLIVLALAYVLPLHAGQKEIGHQLITRLDGHVHVLMPCNWLPGKPMTVIGKYGDELVPQPMPNTELEYSTEPLKKGTNRYVEVVIGEQDRVGLNEATLFFEQNERLPCPDDMGFGNFTR